MKRLNDLYEQITPKTSPQELVQKIISTQTKPVLKKRRSNAMTAIIAAAVSVSVLTVSVGAARGWDYAGIFQSIFGEKSTNISENIVPEATISEDTIDTMNFELMAAAADKHSVLAIIDIYPENGYKLIEEVGGFNEVKPLQDLFIDINSESIAGSGTGISVLEMSEEKLRLSIRMTTSAVITDEKITVGVIQKNSENSGYAMDTSGNYGWYAEFAANYSGEEIFYPKDSELVGTDHEGNMVYSTLKSVEVSPISAYFEINSFDNFFSAFWNANKIYAVLEGGEKVRITNTTSITDTESFTYKSDSTPDSTLLALGFEEPINPDKVCAIVIGEQTVEIK